MYVFMSKRKNKFIQFQKGTQFTKGKASCDDGFFFQACQAKIPSFLK